MLDSLLEIHLRQDGDDCRCVQTNYRNSATPSGWTRQLGDLWDLRKRYEPSPEEILPSWLNPQRAMVILLLRSAADPGRPSVLVGPEMPLARALFDAVRNQTQDSEGTSWLQRMFAVSRLVGNIFHIKGSSTANMEVSLGTDLKPCTFHFFLVTDGESEPVRDPAALLDLASQIEDNAIPPRRPQVTHRSLAYNLL
jgi:hypothetical protein